MTEISEAAFAEADRHVSTIPAGEGANGLYRHAFARFIQQVSDAAKAVSAHYGEPTHMAPFILPEPVDPLAEWFAVDEDILSPQECAASLREHLAKLGLKIVKDKS